jgi:TRAP-type C4-dicarboxylate transport system permease small subunit
MDNISQILINITKKIDLLFNAVSRVCAVISSILLIGVTLIIFVGVVNRTFFEYTWLFVEEYSALALIPISWLTMGYTLRWNQHLKMDIVVRNVPRYYKRILGIFAAVFSLICIIYMTISAIDWFTYTLKDM